MKILWVCNVKIPSVSIALGEPVHPFGGWLSTLSDILKTVEGIELAVCFPIENKKRNIEGYGDYIRYYSFQEDSHDIATYKPKTEKRFREIIAEFEPDILHIFGTEHAHALAAINAFGNKEKTLISIQGVSYACAMHVLDNIPRHEIYIRTIRDIIKNEGILKQKQTYEKRGIYEKKALNKAKYITGRTEFDFACCKQVNPDIQYRFCGEVLRSIFYQGRTWDINTCKRHTIFMSQGNSPIKGTHFLVQAVKILKEKYENLEVYISGVDVTRKAEGIYGALKLTSYGRYIKKMIRTYKLDNCIHFTGVLNESEMCERLLDCNVFVLASTIDNSPNSLCEAMLLGVPCVASYVGGVPDLMTHKEDGYLYQHNA
ncbi:MAG: glycosyltransferase, partial [Clostridia bacterium]|nr:glycosyltransferase [Clostridia bacterium]